MNPNTMTCDECRDELARRKGAHFVLDRELGPIGWCDKDGNVIGDHPYPPTLDGAAGALPEGWWIWDIEQQRDGWNVCAINKDAEGVHFADAMCCSDGENELTARYRLALCCVIAGEGKA